MGSVMTISPTSSTTLAAVGIEGLERDAELRRLDLARVDWLDHDAAAEPAADIRPTAAGLHPHVALHVLVEPEHAFRRDGRTGERDRLERARGRSARGARFPACASSCW